MSAFAGRSAHPDFVAVCHDVVGRQTSVFESPTLPDDGLDWDGPVIGHGHVTVGIAGPPEEQVFILANKEFPPGLPRKPWEDEDDREKTPEPMPRDIARLHIRIPALAGAAFHLEQDLLCGETRARFAGDGLVVRQRAWVSTESSLLVIELSCKEQTVDVTLDLNVPPATVTPVPSTSGRDADAVWVTTLLEATALDPARTVAVVSRVFGAEVLPPADASPGPATLHCRLKAGRPALLATFLVSDRDGVGDPLAFARKASTYADPVKLATVERRHAAWWRGVWSNAFIDLDDRDLEHSWYETLYLRLCGRPIGRDHDFDDIAAMLLGNDGGAIRLFRGWPPGRAARFGGLRVMGAFLVAASTEFGRIGPVIVESEKGGECRLVNPWPGQAPAVSVFTPEGNQDVPVLQDGDRLVFGTTPGAVYIVNVASANGIHDQARIGALTILR